MEIFLRGIRGDGEKVRAHLEGAFTDPPQVIIEDGPDTGGTVNVTVVYPPGDMRDRNSVGANIDAILRRNDYVFCNVTHRDAAKDKPSDVAELIGEWPAL